MAENVQPEFKLHAACDECRTRKLKCSGESPQCSRCSKEGIRCVYSPQKQMGRPRKRRRDDAGQLNEQTPELPRDSSSGSFLGDFALISPAAVNDYSGFPGVETNSDLSNAFMPHDNHTFTSPYSEDPLPAFDFDVGANIDPTLWDAQPIGTDINPPAILTPADSTDAPCTCLSILYLTLTDLQTMTSFSFPAVVPDLRRAMSTASTIIHCEKCPREPFSAIQNVLTLTSLFSALASRFHKVLNEIDQETERLKQAGEKKPFRVGDNSPENMHLHTGTLDCPMGFNIELDPSEWARLARKALKTEVLGGGSNLTPLTTLVDQFEARQTIWHDSTDHYEERARIWGAENMCKDHGDAHCLRLIKNVRTMIASMRFD